MRVSIIVAAYNEEKLIHRCLDSLMEQTLKSDFEVIVIDDGSTDNTYSICKDYESKYPNIVKVIRKVNGGQGLARNDGVKISTGDYIGFVDADDWVDSNMFEFMHETAVMNNSDLVVCDVHKIYEDTGKETFQHSLPYEQARVDIASYIKNGVDNAYSCNKIFKRDIWEKFCFKDMVYEDLEVIIPIISYSKVASYVQKSFYHYFKHSGSTTTTYENPRLFDILFAYRSVIQNSNPLYFEEVVYCVAKRIVINLETEGFKYYRADFIDLVQELNQYFDNNTLIKHDEKTNQIYSESNTRVLPNNILISSSNETIEVWKRYSNRARIIDFEQEINVCSGVLDQLDCHDQTVKDLNIIKVLYKHGGILVDTSRVLKSPFGGLRSYENFLVKDEYGNIDCSLMGFQKKHKLLYKMLCFYNSSVDHKHIDLSTMIGELLKQDKNESYLLDVKIMTVSQLNEIVLLY